MESNLAAELWAAYAWWSCVLVLKMNALTWFTGRIRATRQVKMDLFDMDLSRNCEILQQQVDTWDFNVTMF